MAAEFLTWLQSLSDDELLVYRFELYDRLEVADESSETARFARGALQAAYAVERARESRAVLRTMAVVAAPDVDADAFADAVLALSSAQRQLDSGRDAVEIFQAALEVANHRAANNDDEQEHEHDD